MPSQPRAAQTLARLAFVCPWLRLFWPRWGRLLARPSRPGITKHRTAVPAIKNRIGSSFVSLLSSPKGRHSQSPGRSPGFVDQPSGGRGVTLVIRRRWAEAAAEPRHVSASLGRRVKPAGFLGRPTDALPTQGCTNARQVRLCLPWAGPILAPLGPALSSSDPMGRYDPSPGRNRGLWAPSRLLCR